MTTFLSIKSHEENQQGGSYACQDPPETIERTRVKSMMMITMMNEDDSFPMRRPATQKKQSESDSSFLQLAQKPLQSSSSNGRQTPRLLTPYSDDFFDDENEDNISTTELTEPEATPWLFRPIAPPDDSADYDLMEHDTFQRDDEDDEDDAWATFMSGIPMEIEIFNEQQRYYIEDDGDDAQENFDQILIALRARSEDFTLMTGCHY